MSADFTLHIYEGINEDTLRLFKLNTIGSAYFDIRFLGRMNMERWTDAALRVGDTPNYRVGEVSWLKASLFEDGEEDFVPNPIMNLSKVFPEAKADDLTVITDEVIEKTKEAFGDPNQTSYQVEELEPLIDFLVEHKGKKVFSVSW